MYTPNGKTFPHTPLRLGREQKSLTKIGLDRRGTTRQIGTLAVVPFRRSEIVMVAPMNNRKSDSPRQNSSGHPVPDRLVGTERFIKLEQESKAPKIGPDGPFFKADSPELAEWIETGGNVGLNLGDLVALDIDSYEFEQLANEQLPRTFSVRSGGGPPGEHRYFRCEWSGRRVFNKDGELGSVRSGNWYLVVPPSVHPETGDQYQVLRDTQITPIPEIQLQDFLKEATDRYGTTTANTGGGGGGGGGGCVGGSPIPEIPSEYPSRDVEWTVAKKWLKSNGLLDELKYSTGDRSGREFLVAKCLAEGGFSADTIADVLDRFPHNSKWHQRGTDYCNRTVKKAILAACNDEFVEFSQTGDMDSNTSESRKTEESGRSRTLRGGVLEMVNDNVNNHVTEKNGSVVVRSGVVHVDPEASDNQWDYMGLLFGEFEEEEEDLGKIVNWEYGEYNNKDYKNLGNRDPEELRLAAKALEQLADNIED